MTAINELMYRLDDLEKKLIEDDKNKIKGSFNDKGFKKLIITILKKIGITDIDENHNIIKEIIFFYKNNNRISQNKSC